MEQKRQTLLEQYRAMRRDMETEGITTDGLWQYQELVYRISVLEICQIFRRTAPISDDTETVLPHYQMLSAWFQFMMTERRSGLSCNPDIRRHQETAYENLLRIVTDHRKRFRHYAVKCPGQYQKDIENLICTVLPAWIQYRDSLLIIKIEEAKL